MNRKMLIALLSLLLPSGMAHSATWANDDLVGVNQVAVTIQVTCLAPGFVCDQVDGYSDTQNSTLTGGSTFVLDDENDQITFDTDDVQDVGMGLQPSYLTMDGSNLVFAGIPFAGVPEIVNLVIFSLSSPPIDVPGISLLAPGDYPFTTSLDYASISETIGDLELILPDIVLPPTAVTVSGTFRVLGDIDFDSLVEVEIRDLTGTLAVQSAGTIGGQPVTIDVTAVLTGNLSGEAIPPEVEVPSMGLVGLGVLACVLAGIGAGGQRRRRA